MVWEVLDRETGELVERPGWAVDICVGEWDFEPRSYVLNEHEVAWNSETGEVIW